MSLLSEAVQATLASAPEFTELPLIRGLPKHDLGPSYFDRRYGVTVTKFENGYGQFRYLINNDQKVALRSLATGGVWTFVDTDTSSTNKFRQIIPGGALVQADTGRLQFRLNFSDAVGGELWLAPRFWDGDTLNDNGSYRLLVGAVSTVLVTLDFTTVDHNTINITGISNWAGGGQFRRGNIASDVELRFFFVYSGANTGRTWSVDQVNPVPGLVITPRKTIPPQAISSYRDVRVQPGRKDAFWNVPLHSSITYADPATDLETINIRDQWAGCKVKSGIRTNVRWIGGQDQGRIPYFQMLPSYPLVNLKITNPNRRGVSFSLPARTFRVRLPDSPLPTGQSGDTMVGIYTEDGRFLWECAGGYSYNAATKTHSFTGMYEHDLYGYLMPNYNYPAYSTTEIEPGSVRQQFVFQDGYRAPGFAFTPGQITKEQLESEDGIRHIIGMQFAAAINRATFVKVANSPVGGNTFSVAPQSCTITAGAITGGYHADGGSLNGMNYSQLITNGMKVYFGGKPNTADGTAYTVNSDPVFDAATGLTTFTVAETIVTTTNMDYMGLKSATNSARFLDACMWPASVPDAAAPSNYLGLTRMGQMWGIPKSVDLTTLALTPEGLKVGRALQNFGAITCDQTGGGTGSFMQLVEGVTAQQIANLQQDLNKLVNNLVRITNYDRTRVSLAIADASLDSLRPKDPIPIY